MSNPGEQRVSFVPPSALIQSLPDATMTISGFWDDATNPYFRSRPDPVRVSIHWPRSKWQGFKADHRDAWWLRWFIRVAPVKYVMKRSFVGTIDVADDTVTVTSLDDQ